jgi:nicotinic acetylcholine receptor alpha-9/nicotinic acetylcholine receptor
LKGSGPSRNGAVDLDDFELIGLTVNNINKPVLPVMHAHMPNTPINGPRTAIPATPPNVQNERRRYSKRKAYSPPPEKVEPEPVDYSQEWHELAHVLDRLFFWILFLAMTVSAIFTLLYPKFSGVEQQMLTDAQRLNK